MFYGLLSGLILLKVVAMLAIVFVSELSLATSALIVFALSFSSTVCVVKLMEDHGEMRTRHGKLGIGISGDAGCYCGDIFSGRHR